jgi:hypothetical protein
MGIEQFDFLDEQAVAMLALQGSITTGLSGVILGIDTIDLQALQTVITTGTSEEIEAAIGAIEEDLATLKTALVAVNTANNMAKEIVSVLRPMIFAEKEKIIGDGNMYYRYICRVCSIQCPEKYRFEPPARTLKYCRLKDDMSANFTPDGT